MSRQDGTNELPSADSHMVAISKHMARHVGAIETVFHEHVSDFVHVDVHIIPPDEERPFYKLFTTGMSDLPMTVPSGADDFRYAELLVALPQNWKLGMDDLEDERWYWPIRWLKTLARFPHKDRTWLGPGHTVPHNDPPRPFALDTELCCILIDMPYIMPPEHSRLAVRDDKVVNFYLMTPIYLEEMNLKISDGAEALVDLFGDADLPIWIDPQRPNVAKDWQ